MFMLIVLFDVIYCLIVTHKLSQFYPKNKRGNGIDIFVVSKTLEKNGVVCPELIAAANRKLDVIM